MSSGGEKVVTVKLRFVSDDEAARRGMRMLAGDADRAAAAQAKLNAQQRAARYQGAVADVYGLRDDPPPGGGGGGRGGGGDPPTRRSPSWPGGSAAGRSSGPKTCSSGRPRRPSSSGTWPSGG